MRTARTRTLGIVVAFALAMSATATGAFADEGAPGSSEEVGEVYVFEEHATVQDADPRAPEREARAAALCAFNNVVDSIHFSKEQATWGILSVHGSWKNINCKATLAVVTVQLEKKNGAGLWFAIGSKGQKTVKSGGGAGKRATSRYTCIASENNQYRAKVDVDVVGVADLPDKFTTPAVTWPCD